MPTSRRSGQRAKTYHRTERGTRCARTNWTYICFTRVVELWRLRLEVSLCSKLGISTIKKRNKKVSARNRR